ncbi:MAG TPA: helix-turn-helix transcriptional regulator [Candidatus Acidoferrum sp.]|nr:helix-turn-helix transcriptional regulator [Candidatus Acidoferrum sp.]
MVLSERLRFIREQKKMTQGDIQSRTGLKRSYVSRLEHGRTIPSVATLEKFAQALGVPLYQFFYDGEQPPNRLLFSPAIKTNGDNWGHAGEPARFLHRLGRLMPRINEEDRKVLLHFASQLVRRKKP